MWSSVNVRRVMAIATAACALWVAVPATTVAQKPPAKKPTADTTKPKSVERIKISKAGGEVALPAKPGVTQEMLDDAVAAERAAAHAREASIRDSQRTLDSIDAALQVRNAVNAARREAITARERERNDSVLNADRLAQEQAIALKRHLARGFYIGLAGGTSTPQSNTRTGYIGGWNAMLPVGWDMSDGPFGFRADLSVDRLGGTQIGDVVTTGNARDLTVWSLNSDVKLRTHAPGGSSRSNVYILAGVGAHRVFSGVYGVTGTNAGKDLSFNDAQTRFGWNAGAGASFAWGPTELFVESRFVQIKTDLTYHANGGIGTYTSFMPIVVGLQWF